MPNAHTEELDGKRRKAKRYASERERFQLDSLSIKVWSEHGCRIVTLDNGKWSCTCDFFAKRQTCSHVMAVEIILGEFAGIRHSSNFEQE